MLDARAMGRDVILKLKEAIKAAGNSSFQASMFDNLANMAENFSRNGKFHDM